MKIKHDEYKKFGFWSLEGELQLIIVKHRDSLALIESNRTESSLIELCERLIQLVSPYSHEYYTSRRTD